MINKKQQAFLGDRETFTNPSLSAKPVLEYSKRVFDINRHCGDKSGTHKFMRKPYRLAKPYTGKNNDPSEKWFAYYSFINPLTGSYQRFKVYEDINLIKDGKEKIKYLSELIKEINKQLVSGYSPFSEKNTLEFYTKKAEQDKYLEENPATPSLLEAMSVFMQKRKTRSVTANTLRTYETYINNIERWLMDVKEADLNVIDFDEAFIYRMLSDMNNAQKWGETHYNNHLAFVRGLINFFASKPQKWIKKDDYEFGVNDLQFKTAKVLKHQYFTDHLRRVVKPELDKNPPLELYMKFIYFSCMRPDEIRHLKIHNVDVEARTIKIVGKTNNRAIPICDELADIIYSLELQKYPTDYYLIGSSGKPSVVRHRPDYFSKQFLKIKRDNKLPEGLTPYGMKHSRIIDLINAGFKDAEIMNLSGHMDTDSYNKYKRDLMGNIVSTMRGKTVEW